MERRRIVVSHYVAIRHGSAAEHRDGPGVADRFLPRNSGPQHLDRVAALGAPLPRRHPDVRQACYAAGDLALVALSVRFSVTPVSWKQGTMTPDNIQQPAQGS